MHLNIGTTAGWGTSNFLWKNDEFIGPFGGFSLSIDKFNWMNLLLDYDGTTINGGIRFVCFRHLFLTAGTMNFDSFTATISYRFNLIR